MAADDLVRRRARQLAADTAAAGDPAGWFETLYAEAQAGTAVVPWDDQQANPHLTSWAAAAAERGVAGPGRRALVVGCGVSEDPVFLDRKSTRLNSSHMSISYAVFCLKKKN